MTPDYKNQLRLEDEFTFACHRGLECYTSCCRDVTIMLTPYDVLRLSRAIGLTTTEFIDKYTQVVQLPNKVLPMVQFRMNDADDKKCHFVRPHGCQYYEHRPWACRMFPLDEFSKGGFQVVTNPQRCHGLAKGDSWKVRDWLMDQGATQSKEMDGGYESLVAHEFMNRPVDIDNPKVQQMLLLALYDLDRFREFVFKSSFLERFDLDQDTIDAAKMDDLALLDLAYAWVRFGLLGQKSLKLKDVEAQNEADNGAKN